ncbi:MAG: hypothetical protein JJU20_00860 [Opitutales bacterium]|nr:hypothetical protein [Opitutales bacterium]
MIDFVKKTILAGVGATVVTADRVEAILQDLVKQGKITADESKEAAQKIVDEGRKEFENAEKELNKKFDDMLHKSPVVFRKDFENLEKRVAALEAQLAEATATKK